MNFIDEYLDKYLLQMRRTCHLCDVFPRLLRVVPRNSGDDKSPTIRSMDENSLSAPIDDNDGVSYVEIETRFQNSIRAVIAATSITFICTFLPWVKVLVFSVSGIDIWYGKVTLASTALALTLFYFLTKSKERQRLFTVLISGALALTNSMYVYISCAMSAAFTSEDGSSFTGFASRGIGLEVGVISSAIALGLSLTILHHVFTGHVVQERSAVWREPELFAVGAASAGLSLLSFFNVFVVPIVGGVLVAGVWFGIRRSRQFSLQIGNIVLAAAVLTVGVGIIEGIVFQSQGDSSSVDAGLDFGDLSNSDSSSMETDSSTEDSITDTTLESDQLCAKVFANMKTTDEASDIFSCRNNGETVYIDTNRISCTNDSVLVYNDYGWGKAGSIWNVANSKVIGVGDCLGLKSDLCSQAFAPGVTTEDSWEYKDLWCVGIDGKLVSVPSLFAMSCFQSDKRWITNEFGWGYLGEPWQTGDGPTNGC